MCLLWFFPLQALQALGFVLSGDGDVDSLSADEKSDGEGKNDRMSTSSSSTSITSSTDTQEVWSSGTMNTCTRVRQFVISVRQQPVMWPLKFKFSVSTGPSNKPQTSCFDSHTDGGWHGACLYSGWKLFGQKRALKMPHSHLTDGFPASEWKHFSRE